MLHLAAALNQRALGEPEAALMAAEAALQAVADGGDGAGFVEEQAKELVEELEAEARPLAVGE